MNLLRSDLIVNIDVKLSDTILVFLLMSCCTIIYLKNQYIINVSKYFCLKSNWGVVFIWWSLVRLCGVDVCVSKRSFRSRWSSQDLRHKFDIMAIRSRILFEYLYWDIDLIVDFLTLIIIPFMCWKKKRFMKNKITEIKNDSTIHFISTTLSLVGITYSIMSW